MSLSLDEKFGGKEIFSSSHGLSFHRYFTRNWVLFITVSQSQTSYLLYHRKQQSQDSNSTWTGCTVLMEALGTLQNIPLLNFYSITLFLFLIISLCYSLHSCCLYHGFFSFVERAPESHPSVSSTIRAGKVWNVGAAPFSSTQKSQGSFLC